MFQGSGGPLVGGSIPRSDHFGTDGLGDVIEDKDPQWEEKIQREHAVNAMIRLVTENQKQVRNLSAVCLLCVAALWCCTTKMCSRQVSLVALGPLTNLALAVRLDPCFPQKLKDLYIMGGNMEGNTTTGLQRLFFETCKLVSLHFVFVGKGNVTLCVEFNFAMDPDSAYVVLEEFLCPTYLASWEYCCRNMLTWVSCVPVKNHTTLHDHSTSN